MFLLRRETNDSTSLVNAEMHIKTSEILLHTIRMATKKKIITSFDKVVGKLESLCTADGDVKCCSHCGKQCNSSSKS